MADKSSKSDTEEHSEEEEEASNRKQSWVPCIQSFFSSPFSNLFTLLRGSPGSLWAVYALKFLESYSYFSMAVVFTIFLSNEFQLTDTQAGTLYGIKGMFTSVYGLVVGFLVDRIGVKKSLIMGAGISLIGRLVVTFTDSLHLVALMLYLVLPLGGSLCIPVLTLGIKCYTTPQNRGYAFGVFYSVMNVGVLLSGLVVDFFTISMPKTGLLGLSVNRWIFATGALCSAIQVVLALVFIKDTRVGDSDSPKPKESKGPMLSQLGDILRSRTFWRLFALTLIMINIRSIFRHLDATLPKYMVREFGENVAKGSVYSVNPLCIIFMVPIISALTQKFNTFDCIIAGAYISAFSVFVLSLHTSVAACIIFIMILSVGESLWSPRLYDYTMSVAPDGKEGAFMALSSAPVFLSALPVGWLSGFLLEIYCPATGPRDSQTMWLIIGALTLSSPVILTLTQHWIREPETNSKKDNDPVLLKTINTMLDKYHEKQADFVGTANNEGMKIDAEHELLLQENGTLSPRPAVSFRGDRAQGYSAPQTRDQGV